MTHNVLSKSRPSSPRRGHLFALSLLTMGLLCLSGCFGSSSPERTYFSVQYAMGNQSARYIKPRYPKMLRVQRFDSAISYNRQEIVYRSNPHQFKYYWYRLWSARPPKMLRELIATHLRHSNLFDEVSLNITERLPDYELRAEILSIEELNASDTEWYAHLAMRFEIVRYEDGAQIWQYTFDERKAVHIHQPVYVVRTMSEILEEQMEVVLSDIDEVIASETGIKAPTPMLPEDPSSTSDGTPDEKPDEKPQPKATLKERP